jgi:GntR family transcriptional regulator
MPQPEETEALDLPTSGSPVVDIVRTAFTEDGRAVEVNEMTLDASAYILQRLQRLTAPFHGND